MKTDERKILIVTYNHLVGLLLQRTIHQHLVCIQDNLFLEKKNMRKLAKILERPTRDNYVFVLMEFAAETDVICAHDS